MSHIRGHIIKKGNESRSLSLYQRSGDYYHYIFYVTDYLQEYDRINATDSKEDEFGDVIVILAKDLELDNRMRGVDFDFEVFKQDVFDYAREWVLDNRSNWLVYDKDRNEEIDEHEH